VKLTLLFKRKEIGMNGFIFDDLANIAMLCFVMGVGVVVFVGVVVCFLMILSALEDA